MYNLNGEDFVLVTGFAQTPKGTPLNETLKYISAILVIDRKTNCIVESDFGVISKLTNQFLQTTINGYCVDEPFEDFVTKTKQCISVPSLGAIQQAVKSAIDRYKDSFDYRK
ncbi:hypothetical protein JCM17380_09040 [Desulfosporosinus burensis]